MLRDRCFVPKHRARFGIRVGLMQIQGISDAEIESILTARAERPFGSFGDFCRRARVSMPVVENLINVGAFDSFGYQREKLLWLVGDRRLQSAGGRPKARDCSLQSPASSLDDTQLRFQDDLCADNLDDQIALLPDMPERAPHERVRMDYEIMGLSPLCHPMVFYREKLCNAGVRKTEELRKLRNGSIIKVAGVVVVCMRPPTKSGAIVVFITLEDEAGLADCVVFPKVYAKYGPVIFNNAALIVEGRLQRMGKAGISVIVHKVAPLTDEYHCDGAQVQKFKERIRIAGERSFVRGGGV